MRPFSNVVFYISWVEALFVFGPPVFFSLFPDKANVQCIWRGGEKIGSVYCWCQLVCLHVVLMHDMTSLPL